MRETEHAVVHRVDPEPQSLRAERAMRFAAESGTVRRVVVKCEMVSVCGTQVLALSFQPTRYLSN